MMYRHTAGTIAQAHAHLRRHGFLPNGQRTWQRRTKRGLWVAVMITTVAGPQIAWWLR